MWDVIDVTVWAGIKASNFGAATLHRMWWSKLCREMNIIPMELVIASTPLYHETLLFNIL